MAYDWTNDDDNPIAPRMDEGYHPARIAKVITVKKDGANMTTSKGDRKILVVFEDEAGNEASQSYPVEGKAVFNLKRLCKTLGMDREKMKANGVEPADFLDQSFVDKHLVGRDCWVNVEHQGEYANAEAVHPDDVPPHALQRAKAGQGSPAAAGAVETLDVSDIPF